MPTAIENADAFIEASNKALAALGDTAAPEQAALLKDAVTAMEKMKTQFFIKTNFALPPTKACLKNAVEVQSIAESGDTARLADALTGLQESVEKLLSLSKMEGVALT